MSLVMIMSDTLDVLKKYGYVDNDKQKILKF